MAGFGISFQRRFLNKHDGIAQARWYTLSTMVYFKHDGIP